jgi:hypothetical protein
MVYISVYIDGFLIGSELFVQGQKSNFHKKFAFSYFLCCLKYTF